MPHLPAQTPKEVVKILERAGFVFVRQVGSHKLYRKENSRVTVPYHNKDLKPKTLLSIVKQVGLSKGEWLELM